MQLWKYLSFSLIVRLRGFRGRFMLKFHVRPDLDILFEKLTAQVLAWPRLGMLLHFEAPGELQVDKVKMQQLTSG